MRAFVGQDRTDGLIDSICISDSAIPVSCLALPSVNGQIHASVPLNRELIHTGSWGSLGNNHSGMLVPPTIAHSESGYRDEQGPLAGPLLRGLPKHGVISCTRISHRLPCKSEDLRALSPPFQMRMTAVMSRLQIRDADRSQEIHCTVHMHGLILGTSV